MLTARSLDGQAVSFADLLVGSGKATCYTFLHPTCPLAQRYVPVLVELDKEFDDQGIHFVGPAPAEVTLADLFFPNDLSAWPAELDGGCDRP